MTLGSRAAAVLLAAVMVFTPVAMPSAVSASSQTDARASAKQAAQIEIVSFDALDAGIASQSVSVGNEESDITLPDKISGTDASGQTVSVPVTWKPDRAFSSQTPGDVFTFTAEIKSGYISSAVLPKITVRIKDATGLTISGLMTEQKNTAGKDLTDDIQISPAGTYDVELQMFQNGKWIRLETFTTDSSGYVVIKYPRQWYAQESSKWRVVVRSSGSSSDLVSSTVNVTAKRVYQTPGNYFKIHSSRIVLHGGGYTLRTGYMGLKVRRVNHYFGIGSHYWPRYTYTTKRYVKKFQRRHHLKATGNVNEATWLKMGFSRDSWYHLGSYTSPLKVSLTSTKKQCVEAMISRAYQYKGADYTVGASGTPSQGCDCSGLVMQCLYAAGIDPLPSSSVRHSHPGYEYESAKLFANKKLKKVSVSHLKRGDLVFYGNSSVYHIAIYLGHGRIIDSWPNHVKTHRLHFQPVMGARRVFA